MSLPPEAVDAKLARCRGSRPRGPTAPLVSAEVAVLALLSAALAALAVVAVVAPLAARVDATCSVMLPSLGTRMMPLPHRLSSAPGCAGPPSGMEAGRDLLLRLLALLPLLRHRGLAARRAKSLPGAAAAAPPPVLAPEGSVMATALARLRPSPPPPPFVDATSPSPSECTLATRGKSRNMSVSSAPCPACFPPAASGENKSR